MAMTTYTPRPHGEYLEWIDNRLEILKEPLTALEVIAFSGITNVIRASLLANRAVLERQRKNNTSLEHSTMSELKYEDGYNACLAELQTEIYDLIRSVMG